MCLLASSRPWRAFNNNGDPAMSRLGLRCLLVLPALVFCGSSVRALADNSRRLTVSLLFLYNGTREPAQDHWQYGFDRLIRGALKEVKGLRVRSVIKPAYRQLHLNTSSALSIGQARKLGEIIEAGRVI